VAWSFQTLKPGGVDELHETWGSYVILSDVMTRRPITIEAQTPIHRAEEIARSSSVRHLLVVEKDNLVGVLCLCDIAGREMDAPVSSAMTPEPKTATSCDPVESAFRRMQTDRIGCLPVFQGSNVIGIVTRSDLRRAGILEARDPEERRCVSCGDPHGLHLDHTGDAVAFCVECLQTAFAPEDGGSD
jgi:CBS domain-containing protein